LHERRLAAEVAAQRMEFDGAQTGAALRLDHHQSFERQSIDRAGDREPRHCESGAPFVLVDQDLRRERSGYDGLLEREISAVDLRLARATPPR